MEATLAQLTEMFDSPSQGSESAVDGQSDGISPLIEDATLQKALAESTAESMAEPMAESMAEPQQSIAADAHDQDASDEQPEESGQDEPESSR